MTNRVPSTRTKSSAATASPCPPPSPLAMMRVLLDALFFAWLAAPEVGPRAGEPKTVPRLMASVRSERNCILQMRKMDGRAGVGVGRGRTKQEAGPPVIYRDHGVRKSRWPPPASRRGNPEKSFFLGQCGGERALLAMRASHVRHAEKRARTMVCRSEKTWGTMSSGLQILSAVLAEKKK